MERFSQAVRFGGGDDAHTRRQEARSRQRRCTATAPLSTADDARGDDTYKDDDVEEAAPIEEAQDTLQKVNATADDARGDDSYEDDDVEEAEEEAEEAEAEAVPSEEAVQAQAAAEAP